ncbi:hypothetical protein GOD68_28980 [Sinorhizobium medicae]|nr:hypothetical protein [Sinorhizobium medicae]MDX0673039.1 hypothetical protein [Sinorhizobium medicae]MDX0710331.1 hypothetical protein [Sinorhizobium medicae]
MQPPKDPRSGVQQAGTLVFLGYCGRLAIERGFVKLGEVSSAIKPKAPIISHSAALIEDLAQDRCFAYRTGK